MGRRCHKYFFPCYHRGIWWWNASFVGRRFGRVNNNNNNNNLIVTATSLSGLLRRWCSWIAPGSTRDGRHRHHYFVSSRLTRPSRSVCSNVLDDDTAWMKRVSSFDYATMMMMIGAGTGLLLGWTTVTTSSTSVGTTTTACETRSTTKEGWNGTKRPDNDSMKNNDQQLDQDHERHQREIMVSVYTESLMANRRLILLPFGLGTTSPIVPDFLGLNKSLVEEAINAFELTLESWNRPPSQSTLVGHPIVYETIQVRIPNRSTTNDSQERSLPRPSPSPPPLSRSRTIRMPLVHHPELSVPWELLQMVADALMEDPRVAPGILSEDMEKQLLMNVLQVLCAILTDIVLSSSIRIHGGILEMNWTFHPTKWDEYVRRLLDDRGRLCTIVQACLEEIDFDLVEKEAAAAVAKRREDGDTVYYGEQQVYRMAFTTMLLLFYWFNLDTECRFLGHSVRQRFVRPSNGPPTTVH